MKKRPVILMRPGEANNRLAQKLEREGHRVWRWPAFRIELPENAEMVEAQLSDLTGVDMVILPSPSAVAAVAHWVRSWPEHVTLATVGEGTARVIRAAWGEHVKLLYPKGDAAHSGSEALWALVEKTGAPARVLFLRGQTGREWLPEHFAAMGSDVIKLCAYVRVPIELTEEQIKDVTQSIFGPSPIVYITSTDAVDALMRAIRVVPGGRDWLVNGVAVTIHPRVTVRLREAGFTKIEIAGVDDENVADVVRAQEAS